MENKKKGISDRIAFFNSNQNKNQPQNNIPVSSQQKTNNSNKINNVKAKFENGSIANKSNEKTPKNNFNTEKEKKIDINNKEKPFNNKKDLNNNLNNPKPIKNEIINKKADINGNKKNEIPKKVEQPITKTDNEKKKPGLNKIDARNGEDENSGMSKIGQLINGKHPIYGSKKIEEKSDDDNTLYIYDYPLNIEYSSKEETISMLFVGQSGTGKSTFINAYVNHLLGITSDDNIRYKLILGDARKENDQTQSQTDFITIYNVRSLKYNNKLFKLIDTPGAGDTRNDNDNQNSQIEKDKKEKEFLEMYNKLFSQDIGQLNSIVFVVKASENRENEFQKRIVKNITNLFAGDISDNCLAIFTHNDNDKKKPDAIQLMEKIDIFKEKTKKKDNWYFPVSSTSYFETFKKGELSITAALFNFTEKNFISFTNKLLTLKLYYTKQTQKNLKLKKQQEDIIKILKNNILVNLMTNFKRLKDTQINLDKKIAECENQEKEIENIKNQVSHEEELKKKIKENLDMISNSKKQKEEILKKNIENIKALNKKKLDFESKIGELLVQQQKAKKEKREAETKKNNIQKEIDKLKKLIDDKNNELSKKKVEKIENAQIKALENKLKDSENNISCLEKEIELKKNEKEPEEMTKLRNEMSEKQKEIQDLENQINQKKNEKDTEEIIKLKKTLEQSKKNCENLDKEIKKGEDIKDKQIKELQQKLENSKLQSNELKNQINTGIDYDSEIKKYKEELEEKMKESEDINNIINQEKIKKENLERERESIEKSNQLLSEEIENCQQEEKNLEDQIKEEENKLKEQIEKQQQLIDLNNVEMTDEKDDDTLIETIKNKIQEQIFNKKREKEKVEIKYEPILEKDNTLNLICNKCKKNCHSPCDRYI